MLNSFSPLDNLSDKLLSKCPVCGSKNDVLEMTIIDDQGENNMVYIECKKCHTSFVGVVNLSSTGASIVSFATDLEKDEIVKFKNGERVSEDDVLELHTILEDKKKDFIKIIK
jgi:hypothetical protein